MDSTLATVAIAAIACFYVGAYQFLTDRVGNPKRVKEINANFKQIQLDLNKAMKEKNDAEIQKVVKRQEAAMPTMLEMMFLMYKPLIAVIPLLVLLSNPQINYNEIGIMAWPAGMADAAKIDTQLLSNGMGLMPAGASVSFANGSLVEISSGGKLVAKFERAAAELAHYTDLSDGHGFYVPIKNESGKEVLYFPQLRVRNTVAVQNMFSGFVIKLPISLPIVIQNFEKFPNWRDTFGPNGWFWLCVVFAGLGASIIKSINEKKDGAKKEGAAAPAIANST